MELAGQDRAGEAAGERAGGLREGVHNRLGPDWQAKQECCFRELLIGRSRLRAHR